MKHTQLKNNLKNLTRVKYCQLTQKSLINPETNNPISISLP